MKSWKSQVKGCISGAYSDAKFQHFSLLALALVRMSLAKLNHFSYNITFCHLQEELNKSTPGS